MADEEIKETEQVVENQEQGVKEETKEPETKEGVLTKIGNMIRGHKEEQQAEPEIELPSKFLEAVKGLNWSEEDIKEFVLSDGEPVYSTEDLIEMIPFLIGENSEESEEASNKGEEVPETKEKKGEDSQEDEKVKELMARIAALEKAQGKSEEEQVAKHTADLVHRASQFFDKKSEEFEIFGKTQTLPKFPDGRVVPNSPQVKARQEVWDLACRLNSTGIDWDESLELSFSSYKGKNLANDVKRNYIKDLKKNEQRLTGKPIRHEASSNVVERGADVVREVARKHGREIL